MIDSSSKHRAKGCWLHNRGEVKGQRVTCEEVKGQHVTYEEVRGGQHVTCEEVRVDM